jgi:hypothetical protein
MKNPADADGGQAPPRDRQLFLKGMNDVDLSRLNNAEAAGEHDDAPTFRIERIFIDPNAGDGALSEMRAPK